MQPQTVQENGIEARYWSAVALDWGPRRMRGSQFVYMLGGAAREKYAWDIFAFFLINKDG